MSASTHPNTIIWSPAGASRLTPSPPAWRAWAELADHRRPILSWLLTPSSVPSLGLRVSSPGGVGDLVWRFGRGEQLVDTLEHTMTCWLSWLCQTTSVAALEPLGFEGLAVTPEPASRLLSALVLPTSCVVGSWLGRQRIPGHGSREGGWKTEASGP